jgi:hypothetical protein
MAKSSKFEPIRRFPTPARNPPPVAHPKIRSSNATAAHAVRVSGQPGKINPKQH